MTQYERHVEEEEDIDDVIENPEPKGQVPNSIAASKPKRNIQKPARFSDMVVTYALPVEVMKDSAPSTFIEAVLIFESEL